ncbi:MAG: glycosyltransferase [Sphingobium sp.]
MSVAVGIFAHQEERRIAACLASLPLDRANTLFHVLVNGSTDRTAERAREAAESRANVLIHDIAQGGKSRTWNHFIHDLLTGEESAVVLLDGDAQIVAGSVDALVDALAQHPEATAAAGLPANGRLMQVYREELKDDGGVFGDLYALSGRFTAAVREGGYRVPDDLIGDDGLVGAWAHTALGRDAEWDRGRILYCEDAGFLCEPVSLWKPVTWAIHYRRMINYSVRYYQNRIVSDIMTREGPGGLPRRLSDLYPAWLPRWSPRPLPTGWFDRKALARIRKAAKL